MDVYVARQPIFDRLQRVYAYELLYRVNSISNTFSSVDPDQASSHVILDSFHSIGIGELTGGKKAFINFTENLLQQGVATLFPRETLVVEVLENVAPRTGIVEQCRELKRRGYTIALDDFVYRRDLKSLVDLADIIKIDFLQTSRSEQKSLVHKLNNGKIRFLAEKVESHEEFDNALAWGYSLFQGYFFSKPVIVASSDIDPVKINYLQLIQKVHGSEIDFAKVGEIIARDVSLSYKLLRLVNSAAFGLKRKIDSVHQALVMLGSEEIKKWVSLMAMKGMGEGKPDELLRKSLIRAKMGEILSGIVFGRKKDELFLTGLFSMLDILMNRPMSEVLADMPVDDVIKKALLFREGIYGWLLQIVSDMESGNWEQIRFQLENLGIRESQAMGAYLEAVRWSDAIDLE